METRINLNDSIMSMIMKMAGGNPGAMRVCSRLIQEAGAIDPNAVLGGIGAIMYLDTLHIYESQIWMLYKDICGEDLTVMVGMMRGVQLGIIRSTELTSPLSESYASIPLTRIDEVMGLVRARLPEFAK